MKNKNVEKQVEQEVQNQVVTVELSELEALKAKIAQMNEEHQTALSSALRAKEEAELKIKELKGLEKEELEKIKALEAKTRAKSLAEALKKQETAEPKRNLTQAIRELMLEEKTVDEMMVVLGVSRKEILDRRWLIEKRAGLR
jgi:transposase